MEPANPTGHDRFPVEIANLQPGCGFVAAVVEHDRCPDTQSAIAVNSRHIGTGHAIVFELFVKRLNPHGTNTFGNQVANGIVDHGRGDTGFHAKTVCQVGGHIEFAPTDMNLTFMCLAEGDNSRIQPMDQSPQRE